MFFYALGVALRTCYGNEEQLRCDLRKLSNPAWTGDGPEGKVQKVIERLSKLVFKALKEAYNNASISGTFTHRNWFRSQSSLQAISDMVADSWTAHVKTDGVLSYQWRSDRFARPGRRLARTIIQLRSEIPRRSAAGILSSAPAMLRKAPRLGA
jgi:hypothetical protein